MEQKAEGDLLESGADVHADVLKAGHHGSPTSSSEVRFQNHRQFRHLSDFCCKDKAISGSIVRIFPKPIEEIP